MDPLPPLASLRAFEAASRHLSVKKAADRLNVTPSAVSHQIAKLEERLGVKLFHRVNEARFDRRRVGLSERSSGPSIKCGKRRPRSQPEAVQDSVVLTAPRKFRRSLALAALVSFLGAKSGYRSAYRDNVAHHRLQK